MALIYLLLVGAFALGWILRGAMALRDVRELDDLRAQVLDLEAKARLDVPTKDWARRQGLMP